MKYKPFYSDMLVISSVFYLCCAFLDYFITMCGYAYYGDLFFQLEMNPFICNLVKMGIPPIHMFIIPMVVLFLSIYFRILTKEINADSIIRDGVIWGMGFSSCIMIMMGILHLLGFISWFYYGVF